MRLKFAYAETEEDHINAEELLKAPRAVRQYDYESSWDSEPRITVLARASSSL
jgi:hypothetical protein